MKYATEEIFQTIRSYQFEPKSQTTALKKMHNQKYFICHNRSTTLRFKKIQLCSILFRPQFRSSRKRWIHFLSCNSAAICPSYCRSSPSVVAAAAAAACYCTQCKQVSKAPAKLFLLSHPRTQVSYEQKKKKVVLTSLLKHFYSCCCCCY